MLRRLALVVVLVLIPGSTGAAPKPHVVSFGKWISVKWPDGSGNKLLDLKVRPLIVDGRVKEYTTGAPHDVTDRMFAVQRAFRLNDALPGESGARWVWQRGGWLLVDRVSGRVSQLSLPEFDPFYSAASWFRDYVAYCGVSDDGKKLFAMVMQVGRRKPILKKPMGEPAGDDEPDSECPAPVWHRAPIQVTFEPDDTQKVVFSIRGRVVDVLNEPDEEAEE